MTCPDDVTPADAAAAIRAEAIRLLPQVDAGHAFRDAALVNAQEIFWADTPTVRTLPDVTIVGQNVEIQISLTSVAWDFGDGHADTTSNPGKPYDNAHDPCNTVECPHYYGHTYRQARIMTVTTAITWHARYRVNGGAWTDIADPITGPDTTEQLRVIQARGVLVPNPNSR